MKINYVTEIGIHAIGQRIPEMTFEDDNGTAHTIRQGEFAYFVFQGRHLRVSFNDEGVQAEEIDPKEADLRKTAAAVAKVMGW